MAGPYLVSGPDGSLAPDAVNWAPGDDHNMRVFNLVKSYDFTNTGANNCLEAGWKWDDARVGNNNARAAIGCWDNGAVQLIPGNPSRTSGIYWIDSAGIPTTGNIAIEVHFYYYNTGAGLWPG